MNERVRVTGPARRRATTGDRSGTREIDAGTELGRVYMQSLLREQLRLALGILGLLVVTVGMLPLVFHLLPGLAEVRVGPLPLSWLLLGVVVYPWLIVLGWFYIRRSEANERDFASLVEEVER
ncbi:hypothetical protein [Nocardioides currus]|uniref:DUF485 domain-containing protein n=1 Tax=Nocardioides currus TaxID=2133958 RepID=A0A2R7Z2P1_9ACTN|nr:hypothetical protein [Nocardioides currus]PUA82844.1 hypothetical protein C7S10_03790 [Nocardioides currus]